MKTRPLTLMNITLTAVLITSLFMMSAIPSSSLAEYDPWCDLDDDGNINIFDVVKIAGRYGTSGMAVNKTELLYNVSDTFSMILSRMDALNVSLLSLQTSVALLETTVTDLGLDFEAINNTISQLQIRLGALESRATGLEGNLTTLQAKIIELKADIAVLETTVDALNTTIIDLMLRVDTLESNLTSRLDSLESWLAGNVSRIGDLEVLLAIMNATKLGAPDFDSGWVAISWASPITFNHYLGTTDLLVYVIGYNATLGINQIRYGGDWYDSLGLSRSHGAYWYGLTTTQIKVYREYWDTSWPQIRVMIWKIPQP